MLLFPGSFNPMHVGHLAIANFIAEQYSDRFDEVWLLLTPNSPFKEKIEKLPTEFRAKWIGHLIKGYPQLKLSLEESNLTPPYYTVHTVQYLKGKYPKFEFTLLIGADSLMDLPEWYGAEQLLKEIKIIAYPRPAYDKSLIKPEILEQVELLDDVPTFEISSSQLRKLLREGKALPYLLGTKIDEPLYRQLHQLLISSK
ncbi:MAG: nicotinate (nicotinamide) nucleotide adenylyltransferase [Bacteroidales bacterium]|uniref:nicotinate (nicotinamide) nucleotide adenylyltransferase n=1 Tax=Porphyromonas sp. TaxID=1924944 RepID=UPI0029778BB8|nr:nicotinate (nicotinamide) nucleotide adenylyltransferase [Porphyromonas sp.]MDD7437268.1 nicotinate (nicotinamide) nucleotide adenylyltransferase [Bacteroidales bacterium]MDY3068031.1 nicotinate (nicotinamide) nucleotide adenylyltransferase [Porphyromonas sp.]